MKKLLAFILTALMVMSLVPLGTMATESSDIFVIENETSATYNTLDGFYTNAAINANTTAGAIMDTLRSDAKDAIKLTGTDINAQWNLAEGDLQPGMYEVQFYNIAGTEAWRVAGGANAKKERMAQYTVTSANGKSVYYVNQEIASGNANGWVTLGTFEFSGNAGEGVRLDKNFVEGWASIAYADDVRFIPVTSDKSKLAHIYTTVGDTPFNADKTDIGDETHLTVTLPAGSAQSSITVEAAAPDSEIRVTPKGGEAAVSTGKATITPDTATQMQYYNVNVIKDGVVARYTLTVEIEQSEGTEIEFVDTTDSVSNKSNDSKYGSWKRFVAPATGLTAGYYNVYALVPDKSSARGTAYGPYMNVMVDANGLRQETTIPWDCYIGERWVYVGKYNFQNRAIQEYKEMITFMQSTPHTVDISKIKLVPSVADAYAPSFQGVSIQKGSGVQSINKEAFAMGNNWVSDATGSIGLMLHQANTATRAWYTLNGSAPTKIATNSAAWMTTLAGENTIEIIYYNSPEDNTSGVKEKYVFTYYGNDNTNIATVAGYQATVTGTKSDFWAPISSDCYRNGKQTAAPTLLTGANAAATYSPKFAEKTVRRVIAWKPVFKPGDGTVFGSKAQRIVITADGKTYEKTVDWQSGSSNWVDLGAYTFSTADDNVTIYGSNDTNGFLYNKVLFAKVTKGLVDMTIDGVTYTDGDLTNAGIIPVYNTKVNVSYNAGADTVVSINGTPLTAETNEITLKIGVNNVAVTTNDSVKTYNLTVIAKAEAAHYNDAENIIDGNYANSDVKGYNGTDVIYLTDATGSATFSAANVVGKAKIAVYIPETEDANKAETINLTVTDSQGEYPLTASVASAGWVDLEGEYIFGGGNGDVLITGIEGKNVYVNCVRFEIAEDVIYNDAEIIKGNTETYANVNYFAKKNNANGGKICIASYSDGQMTDVKMVDCTELAEGTGVIKTEAVSNGDMVKVFIFDTSLRPMKKAASEPKA